MSNDQGIFLSFFFPVHDLLTPHDKCADVKPEVGFKFIQVQISYASITDLVIKWSDFVHGHF